MSWVLDDGTADASRHEGLQINTHAHRSTGGQIANQTGNYIQALNNAVVRRVGGGDKQVSCIDKVIISTDEGSTRGNDAKSQFCRNGND